MTMEDCPLPEVAKALSPFIKSRDAVANIRLELQNYLQKQLRTDEASLSSINLTEPQSETISSPSASVTGIRRSYWKAVQAHSEAQAKYDSLRAELDQLKHGKGADGSDDTNAATSLNEDYMTLLRQREKHRKLKVIDHALSNMSSAGGDSPVNALEDIIKQRSGEAPTPPVSQPSFNRNPEVEAKIMELKKAIVSTKRRTEEQRKRASPPVNGTSSSNGQGEIAGFQRALQELTIWMEDQLTLIANAEAYAQPAEDEPAVNGTTAKSNVSMEDIEALYEQYLEARKRLIETANEDSADPDPDGPSLYSDAPTSKSLDGSTSIKSSAEIVLPHIPALIAAKEEEQALLQQTAHARRNMAGAEDTMSKIIRRFAGESHLVQPDASEGKDWAAAARQAGDATEVSIKERLSSGIQAAKDAQGTLNSIQKLPESLNSSSIHGRNSS